MAARRNRTRTQKVWGSLEEGIYESMVEIMRRDRRWKDDAAFVREAVIEKIQRDRAAGHLAPAGPLPGEPEPKLARGKPQ
jgi:hypothetical protein